MDKIDKCEKCGNLDVSYYCQYCDEPLVKSLQQELADLRAKLSNSTSLKNTYHDNWQDAKGTIDSQAEVINNLTVRWGKVCRELADLKAEHKELAIAEENLKQRHLAMRSLKKELAKGKRLINEMFAAHKAFGLCDYPSGKLHAEWMAAEKKVKEWSGK